MRLSACPFRLSETDEHPSSRGEDPRYGSLDARGTFSDGEEPLPDWLTEQAARVAGVKRATLLLMIRKGNPDLQEGNSTSHRVGEKAL